MATPQQLHEDALRYWKATLLQRERRLDRLQELDAPEHVMAQERELIKDAGQRIAALESSDDDL